MFLCSWQKSHFVPVTAAKRLESPSYFIMHRERESFAFKLHAGTREYRTVQNCILKKRKKTSSKRKLHQNGLEARLDLKVTPMGLPNFGTENIVGVWPQI